MSTAAAAAPDGSTGVAGWMARLPYAALFYPYATFGDERWLKESLLTWDRVALIRPAPVEEALAEVGPVEQAIVASEPDFVRPITPDHDTLRTLFNAFEETSAGTWIRLAERYGPEQRAMLNKPARNTRQAAPAEADPRLVWLAADEKMMWGLAHMLQERGLAEEFRDHWRFQRWLGLHPRFAVVYMTALAGELGRRRGLVSVTDDHDVHRVAGALDLAALDDALTGRPQRPTGRVSAIQQAESMYLHTALAASPHPVDIDQIPIEKLLEFRAEHATQLKQFRSHLLSLGPRLAGVAGILTVDDLAEAMNELYKTETKPLVTQLREDMNRAGFLTALRSLTVKLDLAGTGTTLPGFAAGALATAVGAPLAAGVAPVAVALVAAPLVTGYRQARRAQAESPVAFLLAAERELSPEALLRATT